MENMSKLEASISKLSFPLLSTTTVNSAETIKESSSAENKSLNFTLSHTTA